MTLTSAELRAEVMRRVAEMMRNGSRVVTPFRVARYGEDLSVAAVWGVMERLCDDDTLRQTSEAGFTIPPARPEVQTAMDVGP